MKDPGEIEGASIEAVGVNSLWEADLGEGCELDVRLSDGSTLFVIRTGLEDAEEEIEDWRGTRVGQAIEATREIAQVPLSTHGRQTTVEVTLEDGFSFEADLIQGARRVDKGTDELETEWTFEGTPGVEMGEDPGGQDPSEG